MTIIKESEYSNNIQNFINTFNHWRRNLLSYDALLRDTDSGIESIKDSVLDADFDNVEEEIEEMATRLINIFLEAERQHLTQFITITRVNDIEDINRSEEIEWGRTRYDTIYYF